MNWLTKLKPTSMIKTAAKNQAIFDSCTFHGDNTFNINSGYSTSNDDPSQSYTSIIKNQSRYGSDTHRVWIFKTSSNNQNSVVLEIKNERDGMLVYSDYWHYDPNEKNKVELTFNKLINITDHIKNNIESEHIPIPMISTMFKSATRYLDFEHKENSSTTNFNYSWQEPVEKDWRKSLYGDRYPKVNDPSIFQDSWINQTEKSSQIETTGNKSRNKQYRINYL